MSLRDKIDGNELDLSLNLLKEVPVKELANASKATHLDISCNHFQTLPNDFATLTHLVKIDLSKNRLVELPANFGNLVNLQYLDLYSNQIVELPLSFGKLKNLRWLDLKCNPLSPALQNVAGNCLSEKECQLCAKKVVAYMQTLESDFEREKQKKLRSAREKEAIEKAKLELQLEEQRRIKKLEKQKRKAEAKAKRDAILQNEIENDSEITPGQASTEESDQESSSRQVKGLNYTEIVAYAIFVLCLILLLGISWAVYVQVISIADIKLVLKEVEKKLVRLTSDSIKLVIYYIPIVKEFCLKIIHRYMMNVTYFATEIERMLAYYFHA